MKKILLIILGLIGMALVLLWAAWQIYGWYYRSTNNPEPYNKNLTFVGNDNRNYHGSKVFQNADGSMIIASGLIKMASPNQALSVMMLSPTGKFMWEKTFRFARITIWDFIPHFINKGRLKQSLNLHGINKLDGKYYLLLTRFNGRINEPFILELDDSGKLIKSTKVKLEIGPEAQVTSFMQNGFAYLTYLDLSAKLLNLSILDVKTGNVVNTAMLFYKQTGLRLNSITADKADTTVAFTAYDKKKGCSFYMYTKTLDLKEYFRTEPSSEFSVVKYIGDKLYGVVKEDSLLRIIDLTSLSKPLIVLTDQPAFPTFRAKDLNLTNGKFYLALDVDNPQDSLYRHDVIVRKYAPNGEKPVDFLVQGKRTENANSLLPTADKQMLIIGSSSSMKLNRGFRVFATKFAL